jgi:hypothetical protein
MAKMNRELIFTPIARQQYSQLQNSPADENLLKQVRKTLAWLETDTRHPSLKTHEYKSLKGVNGERIWEAYVQHRTAAAYRIFFHYGADKIKNRKRIPVITIIAITPHP